MKFFFVAVVLAVVGSVFAWPRDSSDPRIIWLPGMRGNVTGSVEHEPVRFNYEFGLRADGTVVWRVVR